jgi:iron-sulfur cluster repair protein YtfE (RIC family)
MKITVLLRNDHEMLAALFNKFKKPSSARSPNGKKDLFNEIRRELQIHSQMEQEIFYPALSATASAEAAALVDKAEHEHRAIERLLQELGNMNGTEKNFEARMDVLMEQVARHIEKEEEEIFDEARKNLPEFRLEELGLELEDRRKILVTLAA